MAGIRRVAILAGCWLAACGGDGGEERVPPRSADDASTAINAADVGIVAASNGRYAFVRPPIFVVSGTDDDYGYVGEVFARVRHALPRRRSGAPDGVFLLNGHGDLTSGAIAAEGWERCYHAPITDALPDPPPRAGDRVTIALEVRRKVRTTARVPVIRISDHGAAGNARFDVYFRRLGCRRRGGAP